jgi:hypothetical protein
MTTADTAAARLRAEAVEVLDAAGSDVDKAARKLDRVLAGKTDLRIALAADYLQRLAGAAAVEPQPAIKLHSRRRKGAHRRPVRPGAPTASQKAGEMGAAIRREELVFQRKMRGGQQLDMIKIRELRAIVQESGHAAGSFVARGYEDAVDAFLCRKLADHCVAADPDATVKDIVNGQTATKMLKDAKREAALFIAQAAARIANDLGGGGAAPIAASAP